MTRFVGAAEAARHLGVKRATLYAYVSRGLVERRVAVDGRTSLYSVDDLEALTLRGRRVVEARPSLDVQISSAVTTLAEEGPRYRGRDVAELARSVSYEQVAELLWTGALRDRVDWPLPTPDDVRAARRAATAGGRPGVPAIIAVAGALGSRHPTEDAPATARRLLGVLPDVFAPTRSDGAGGGDPRLPARLARSWSPGSGAALASALKRALVVLADHELTTSTMAVRLAASVRTAPAEALIAGLAVVTGPLHGAASAGAHALLVESAERGAPAAVARRLAAGEHLPGFGHRIYRGEDPRLGPLLDAVALLPDGGRAALVHDVIGEVSTRIMQRPNVDVGVAALTYTAGLSPDVPIFAVARIAGFVAHYLEELGEPPVRYRGIARARG